MGLIRLLGLHGRYQVRSAHYKSIGYVLVMCKNLQCSRVFAKKLGGQGSVASLHDQMIEIVCVDAPFQVEPEIKLKAAKRKCGKVKLRQWWEPRSDTSHEDVALSLEYLKREIGEKVRFDTKIC